MRPAGEIRQALALACEQLATPGSGCTLRELADAARVGVDACRRAVDNMRRAGVLVKVGERRVSYRNRPVALYAPVAQRPAANDADGCAGLAQALRAWG